jgi:hypothetical protein
MKRMTQGAIGAAVLTLALTAWAQKPITYPAKGQDAAQQSKDDGECYTWAKQSTGIDPASLAAVPPPQGPQNSRANATVRGAAGGAALGAAVGAIGGNAGKGAATGAVVGGAVNLHRRNKQAQAQQQESANQAAQVQGALQTYYRAWGACMSGRGYTVN